MQVLPMNTFIQNPCKGFHFSIMCNIFRVETLLIEFLQLSCYFIRGISMPSKSAKVCTQIHLHQLGSWVIEKGLSTSMKSLLRHCLFLDHTPINCRYLSSFTSSLISLSSHTKSYLATPKYLKQVSTNSNNSILDLSSSLHHTKYPT